VTAAAPEARLRRALGTGFGVAVGVGSMIGAGILRTPADVATALPVVGLFLAAWLAGGLYALLGANALAELGTMIPRSGGQYVFVKRAMGPYAGFLVGWNDWVSSCAAMTAVALAVAGALEALVPALAGRAPLLAGLLLLAVAAFIWRGVRTSDRAQRTTSAIKAIALLALIAACVAGRLWTHDVDVAPPAPLPVPHGPALAAAFVLALQGIIYTYDGWSGVVYFSEEVRDPGRDIPRALFGSVLSVIVLYLLLNAAFLFALSVPALARSPLAAASAASLLFGAAGGMVVQALVVLALPSAVFANTLFASRVVFALARDGAAPAALSRVNAGGTPSAALATSVGVAALFLLGTFERVIAVCSFLFVATYAMSFASLFLLRRREPEAPRPWRAWGHPWTTLLILVASLAFLVGTVAADRVTGLVALALVVASWPVYRLTMRPAR
jgi:basic amino acid/polyamine antiporter, APA family